MAPRGVYLLSLGHRRPSHKPLAHDQKHEAFPHTSNCIDLASSHGKPSDGTMRVQIHLHPPLMLFQDSWRIDHTSGNEGPNKLHGSRLTSMTMSKLKGIDSTGNSTRSITPDPLSSIVVVDSVQIVLRTDTLVYTPTKRGQQGIIPLVLTENKRASNFNGPFDHPSPLTSTFTLFPFGFFYLTLTSRFCPLPLPLSPLSVPR